MRKIFAIVLLVSLTLCISGCVFKEASVFYSDIVETDGFCIAVNKIAKCCFAGSYNCTEYTDYLQITVPDDYQGMPIKQLGGYYGNGTPAPFFVSVADLYMNAPESSTYNTVFQGDIKEFDISEKHTVKDVVFNLNIGKNIEAVKLVTMDVYYPNINEDGSIVLYHPVVNINCSDENTHFYSKNGKLYDKITDALISDFAYAEK